MAPPSPEPSVVVLASPNASLLVERLGVATLWRVEKACADAAVASAESSLSTAKEHQAFTLQKYLAAMGDLAILVPPSQLDDKGKGVSK